MSENKDGEPYYKKVRVINTNKETTTDNFSPAATIYRVRDHHNNLLSNEERDLIADFSANKHFEIHNYLIEKAKERKREHDLIIEKGYFNDAARDMKYQPITAQILKQWEDEYNQPGLF